MQQIQARRVIFDEKFRFHNMLARLSAKGEPELRSQRLFQAAQSHFTGPGTPLDIEKAHLSMLFAAAGTFSDLGDTTAASIHRRVVGVPPERNSGPEVLSQIWPIDTLLSSVSDSLYYAERIRQFRALSISRLKTSSLLLSPSHPDIQNWMELSRQIADDRSMLRCSISISEDLFDMFNLNRLPILHVLSLLGDLDSIKSYLDKVENPDLQVSAQDEYGNYPLHYACMGGHSTVVRYLVQEKQATNRAVNNSGIVPLHWLPMFLGDDIDQIAELLHDPRTCDAVSEGIKIPFHFLWLRGPPLHWAVSCRNKFAVQSLLRIGADIDLEYQGYTALALAVEIHAAELVGLLLEGGARKTRIGEFGRSAMHFVAGNCPLMKRKIIHGDEGGANRKLKLAVQETIAKLKFFGCRINSTDKFGNTALHKAVASPLERGFPEDLYVIKTLLEDGADRNIQNQDNDSVLHLPILTYWCDRPNHLDLFQMLLDDNLSLACRMIATATLLGVWLPNLSRRGFNLWLQN